MNIYRITGTVQGKQMFLVKWLRSIVIPGLTMETVHAHEDRIHVSFIIGCNPQQIQMALDEVLKMIPVTLSAVGFRYTSVDEFKDVAKNFTKH